MSESDHTELVFAFIGSIGADLDTPETALGNKLTKFGYTVVRIHVADDILSKIDPNAANGSLAERKNKLIAAGTAVRKNHQHDILAYGIAAKIHELRSSRGYREKTAYIIHSLKHHAEVIALRQFYPRGFYLIAMNVPRDVRKNKLIKQLKLTPRAAEQLIERDRKEGPDAGQNVAKAFQLADFFVGWAPQKKQIIESVHRFADLVFGNPFLTPTFGEYAMFMAFSASTRSADLSRQVGAVVTKNDEILANGANDCPRKGGGLYWPVFVDKKFKFVDSIDGRDHVRGEDSNQIAQGRIINEILSDCATLMNKKGKPLFDNEHQDELRDVLENSTISDLTEFGRVVHAEMEALLSCARRGIPTIDATVYCTTLPCHYCAKHIIAAGIGKVVFVEPYDKSQAFKHHGEVIKLSYPRPRDVSATKKPSKHVLFEPFFGVGPRRFLDLFSLHLSVGERPERKGDDGKKAPWKGDRPRVKMRPQSYIEVEETAVKIFDRAVAAGLEFR